MKYELIKEIDIPCLLVGNKILKPYIFNQKFSQNDIKYIVLFYQKDPMFFADHFLGENLGGLPNTFLQSFLELYLSEKMVGSVQIILCASNKNDKVKDFYRAIVTMPFSDSKQNKYRNNKSLLKKIMFKIEIVLQILSRTRYREKEKEKFFFSTNARIGYWNLFFKEITQVKKEDIDFLMSQIK